MRKIVVTRVVQDWLYKYHSSILLCLPQQKAYDNSKSKLSWHDLVSFSLVNPTNEGILRIPKS